MPVGHHLFRSGDPYTAVYAVRSGCIKTYSTDVCGREYVHGFHLPGELLGFDAVYPERHRVNANVTDICAVCIVPYQAVASLSLDKPGGVWGSMMTLMSRDLTLRQMAKLGSSATQRTAAFLLDINARLRQERSSQLEITLPMSREDIANYLFVSAETLSRAMTKLQHMGLIRADRRIVSLRDVAGLGLIAQGQKFVRTPTVH